MAATKRPYKKRAAGDRIGSLTLVKRRPFPNNALWRARCDCGRVTHVIPSVAERLSGMCLRCSARARRQARLCKSCGSTDASKFGHRATECWRCERAALRNGRHSCGRAIRKVSGGGGPPRPVLPCPCAA